MNNPPNADVPLGAYCLKKLTKQVHYINTTCGNWFISILVAKSLLNDYGITIVGTLKTNKTELPKDILITKQ